MNHTTPHPLNTVNKQSPYLVPLLSPPCLIHWGYMIQGAKLRKKIGFPFGKPPQKFDFPKIFQAFRKETENLLVARKKDLDFYRLSSRKAM